MNAWERARQALSLWLMPSAVRNSITWSTADTQSEAWRELFGALPVAAGVAVTATSAMRVAAVSACVQRIASISTLPLHLYKSSARERVNNGLARLLNAEPCPQWTAASWWEWVVQGVLLRGDSYTYIVRKGSEPVALWPLHGGCVHPFRRLDLPNERRLGYVVSDGQMTMNVDQDDMLHFAGYGFDGVKSMSVIAWAARNAVGNALAMDEYSGRFFAGGAHPSIVLETDKTMKQDALDTLQAAFASKYSGVENAFRRPLVLTEGVKAKEISVNAEDSQLLDARKFQVIDIARAFGVPPHMIGETTANSSWGTGIEQMGRAFVTYTLNPHCVRFEQEVNRKLMRAGDIYAEFNRDALMEGDSKSQGEAFRAALGGPGTGKGWMTVNEVRKLKNLPPISGGDVLYSPPDKPVPTKESQS